RGEEGHEPREQRDGDREEHRAGEGGLGEGLPDLGGGQQRGEHGHGASSSRASRSGRSTLGSRIPMARTATRPSRSSTTVVGVALTGTVPWRAASAAPSASSIEG